MIYTIDKRIKTDASTIDSADIVCTAGTLSRSLDEAGSASLTLQQYTPDDDESRVGRWIIREQGLGDTDALFVGRVQSATLQYDGSTELYLEGPLAWLADYPIGLYGVWGITSDSLTVSDDKTTITGTPEAIASYIIAVYKYHVEQHETGDTEWQWTMSITCDVGTDSTTLTLSYDATCKDALEMLRQQVGGHILTTYNGHAPVLKWLSDDSSQWPSSDQHVYLGVNITDGTRAWDYSQPTVYMPIGDTIEAIDDDDTETTADDTHVKSTDTTGMALVGQPLTLTNRTDVNSGSDYILTGDETTWGWQVEVITEDAATASELLTKAKADIAKRVIKRIATDISAADLHYAKGYDKEDPIQWGDKVGVSYHSFDATLLISSMDLDLFDAVKTVSLGTPDLDKGTLTSALAATDTAAEAAEDEAKSASRTAKTASKTADKASAKADKAASGSGTGGTVYMYDLTTSGAKPTSSNLTNGTYPQINIINGDGTSGLYLSTTSKWIDGITSIAPLTDYIILPDETGHIDDAIIEIHSSEALSDINSVKVLYAMARIQISDVSVSGTKGTATISYTLNDHGILLDSPYYNGVRYSIHGNNTIFICQGVSINRYKIALRS